jgi:GT2 family glycosyltransferase
MYMPSKAVPNHAGDAISGSPTILDRLAEVLLVPAGVVPMWLSSQASTAVGSGDRQILVCAESTADLEEARRWLLASGYKDLALFFRGEAAELLRLLPFSIDRIILDGQAANWKNILADVLLKLAPAARIVLTNAPAPPELPRAPGDFVRYEEIEAKAGTIVFQAHSELQSRRRLSKSFFRQTAEALWLWHQRQESSSRRELVNLTSAARLELLSSSRSVEWGTEWPFYTHRSNVPSTLPDGSPWPTISIVTPSWNSGRFVEEAILSVLNQGYPNLEYIVIDGGSTDNTVSILKRYSERLAWWISEKDQGQGDAINKGMLRATGQIATWLNADDMLAPGALHAAAFAFWKTQADLVAGTCQVLREGNVVEEHLTSAVSGPLALNELLDVSGKWLLGAFFYQPEVLFKRDLWFRVGGRVEDTLHYVMDYHLWLRFAHVGASLAVIGTPIAIYRIHAGQKTFTPDTYTGELRAVASSFSSGLEQKIRPRGSNERRRDRLCITMIDLLPDDREVSGRPLAKLLATTAHDVHYVRPGLDSIVSISPQPISADELNAMLGGAKPDLAIILGEDDSVLQQAQAFANEPLHTVLLFNRVPGEHTGTSLKLLSQLIPRPAVAATCPVLAAELQRLTREKCATVIPLDFTDEGRRLPPSRQAARALLALPEDAFIVYWPGRNVSYESLRAQVLSQAAMVLGPADVLLTDSPDLKQLHKGGFRCVEVMHKEGAATIGPYAADVVVLTAPEPAGLINQCALGGTPALVSDRLVLPACTAGVAAFSEQVDDSLAHSLMHFRQSPRWREIQGRFRNLDGSLDNTSLAVLHQLHTLFLSLFPELVPNLVVSLNKTAGFTERNILVGWSFEENVGEIEGPSAELGLGRFRWLKGPSCRIKYETLEPGRRTLLLGLRNQLPYQGIRFVLNGEFVGQHEVPASEDLSAETSIFLPVEIGKTNLLELEFSAWTMALGAQKNRACALTNLALFRID